VVAAGSAAVVSEEEEEEVSRGEARSRLSQNESISTGTVSERDGKAGRVSASI